MRQLAQKLKDGKVGVFDVSVPVLGPGIVLVQNHFSLVSAGTEGSTVSTARKMSDRKGQREAATGQAGY